MSKIRTFVAVELSDSVRRRAVALIGRLSADGASFRWVEPRNLHLTLCFLGDVDDRDLNDMCAAVAAAAGEVPSFAMECRGVGAFPDVKRPRTVWLGLAQGHDEMCQLQGAIENSLADLGVPREGRRFHPHLTLGRLRRGGRAGHVTELLAANADFETAAINVEEVVVFSSRLTPQGPVYEVLSRAELKEGR